MSRQDSASISPLHRQHVKKRSIVVTEDPKLHLQFCNLTARLVSIADDQVSGRYAYGEIRLSRLNFYAPLFLRKWHFHRVEYQYKEYFAVFYAPILFAAGVASILLSGFQVAVAVAVQETGVVVNSAALLHVALWSSVVIMLFFCAAGLTILGLFVYKVGKEWRYAIQCRFSPYMNVDCPEMDDLTGRFARLDINQ
ncbi:hypothetical protein E8E12_001265 [Didymella heteroderae]|uniref:Uncharacterized protein n=1 Tax=Didymella heteroderae TaxID=1769908 RepID=A0A9P4WFU2_9PLEO|nr:hypothetical protein E8E12_001265 [Didymella heteroderae]